jgi:hypothetical protein
MSRCRPRRSPIATRILGKQAVEIALADFLHIFAESPETTAVASLTNFLVYPLFQLCFRQIKQAA